MLVKAVNWAVTAPCNSGKIFAIRIEVFMIVVKLYLAIDDIFRYSTHNDWETSFKRARLSLFLPPRDVPIMV
jgi:hypothetical protein